MDFVISFIVAFFIILLIIPIGIVSSNIVGGTLYWAENEKRKNYEETDETDETR